MKSLEIENITKVPEAIYVVGYPKSGNTWLVRLLADVLQSPVRSGVMGGGLELASEINQRLSLPTSATFEILKVHYQPTLFFEEIDKAPTRIAYIYRDFRDVAISAFFYWNKCDEADVQTASFSSLVSLGPYAWLRYYHNRRKLLHYVKKLCTGRIEWFEKYTGTWSQHIGEWHDVSTQLPDANIVFVSYEQLRNNTATTLRRIFHELNLPEPTDKRLQNAVEKQSFEKMKKCFQKMPNDANVPFGKEFNVAFLRKGVAGDWKNFLSPKMGRIIQKYHGKMLFELEYESNPYWYRKSKRGS